MATRHPRSPVEPPTEEASWGAIPSGSLAASTADDTQAEQSPIERVMTALSETADPGARARLMLYRVVPGALGKAERVEYCEDMLPTEFEARGLSGIRDVWGPGTYEARLMGHKAGSPHFVRLAAPRFTLAPVPNGGMFGEVASRHANSANAGIEAALRALADSQARMFEALVDQRGAPAAAPVNPIAQMKEFFEMQKLMREADGSSGSAPTQKSTIGEIVDAIKELKEVSSIVNPGDAPEKSVMEQLLEVATPLVGMVQQALQQRQIPQPLQSVPQGQAPMLRVPAQFTGEPNADASNNPVQNVSQRPVEDQPPDNGAVGKVSQHSAFTPSQDSQAESVDQETILKELQTYLANLVSMAEKGDSVQAGAELVYDKLPDDWIELMHMAVWWDALKTAAPQIEKHEAWFRAVRDEVVKMFAEAEREAEKLDGDSQGA